MTKFILIFGCAFFSLLGTLCTQSDTYYELRIYHCNNDQQIEQLSKYLGQAFVPLMHASGYASVGVFRERGMDTTDQKRLFSIVRANSLEHLENISDLMISDEQLSNNGAKAYLLANHDEPAYDRIEVSWLRGFEKMPFMNIPSLAGPTEEHVFELRSYEPATEMLYRNKVDMFNHGGEIELFESLGFNAVFYAETLTGRNKPNLWYMTSFESMDSRDLHWKSFGLDPGWQKMKAIPKYQNTVSHADVYLLAPFAFSDVK